MFHNARIKLTLWYLLIIMTISLSFSVVIFSIITGEVERFARSQRFKIERQVREEMNLPANYHLPATILPPMTDVELVEDAKRRLTSTLFLVNGCILVLSGGLGFFLAGKTLKPIKDMLEEQNQFITDASHELRTPLTSLKSAIEVSLRDPKLSLSDAKTLLKENIKEINTLQSLSDGLLQLSQYHTPNGTVVKTDLDIQDVITMALKKVNMLAKQKHIHMIYTGEPIRIRGNAYELTELFTILLDNAVKYSEQKKTITVVSKKTDGSLIVSVADEGIGIHQNDIEHIFDRFYRSDSARTKTTINGYGLGLSIAKKIVENYHGTIRVESTLHKGSTFIVQIPIKQG